MGGRGSSGSNKTVKVKPRTSGGGGGGASTPSTPKSGTALISGQAQNVTKATSAETKAFWSRMESNFGEKATGRWKSNIDSGHYVMVTTSGGHTTAVDKSSIKWNKG